MTVWQLASMYQDPDPEAAKLNSAIVNVIIYTFAFLSFYVNVFYVKRLQYLEDFDYILGNNVT